MAFTQCIPHMDVQSRHVVQMKSIPSINGMPVDNFLRRIKHREKRLEFSSLARSQSSCFTCRFFASGSKCHIQCKSTQFCMEHIAFPFGRFTVFSLFCDKLCKNEKLFFFCWSFQHWKLATTSKWIEFPSSFIKLSRTCNYCTQFRKHDTFVYNFIIVCSLLAHYICSDLVPDEAWIERRKKIQNVFKFFANRHKHSSIL